MGRISASVAIAVCLVLLAGCGEKEEPATTGPVVQQTTTGATSSTTTTTSTDPGKPLDYPQLVSYFLTGVSPSPLNICDEGFTEAFLRQAFGDRAACIASRKPGSLASAANLTVTPPVNNGVTVVAEPNGGVYGGDTLRVTLVKQGDRWLIDSIESNAPVGP